MKKEIVIYKNERDALKFLRYFFRKRNDYRTHSVTRKDIDNLQVEQKRKKPDALIIGNTTTLEHIPSDIAFPIIALTMQGHTIKGIRSEVKSGLQYYLLAPFTEEDLDCRMRVAIKKRL